MPVDLAMEKHMIDCKRVPYFYCLIHKKLAVYDFVEGSPVTKVFDRFLGDIDDSQLSEIYGRKMFNLKQCVNCSVSLSFTCLISRLH
ncbi:uncharacterized protein LOC130799153 isoform X2 [Amaranthus tricolor]|uniref:uncharacterized protein LOC130799153 isoform X2 n=1 Tax=Amaranthus tricolor TaxID=29722 RepID=UPI002589FE79|nr:uncharacterized protein LOC130799153 isoform X2 [Amaranthus tricolor]